MTIERCDGCRWWQPGTENYIHRYDPVLKGECRKRPPVVSDGSFGERRWPLALADEWCGAFQAKPWPPKPLPPAPYPPEGDE